MSKPSATPKRNTSEFIKPDIPEQISTLTDTDVSSLPKKEGGPVPPPKYTLEQLLANIPEPDLKALKSNSSEEVDTGNPVGKEVRTDEASSPSSVSPHPVRLVLY